MYHTCASDRAVVVEEMAHMLQTCPSEYLPSSIVYNIDNAASCHVHRHTSTSQTVKLIVSGDTLTRDV